VLDLLGTESAGDWGTYNPRTCVIESLAVKQGSSTGGVEEGHLSDLARSRPRDLSTTWMWFAQQNPNFAKGDCLCVLCSIDLKNMLHGAKNSLFRALGLGSKRMTQPVRSFIFITFLLFIYVFFPNSMLFFHFQLYRTSRFRLAWPRQEPTKCRYVS
jgi:hypothetical protein